MKEEVESALREIYEEYKDKGILAVYLWGSIITDDYDPETSDVDSIAIVGDEVSLSLEKEIQEKLSRKVPDVQKFGFRMLWKSELDGGDTIGNLATYVTPRLLLLDLPNWKYVAGGNFAQADFSLPIEPVDTAIRLHLQRIEKDKQKTVSEISPDRHMYFLKELSRIAYLLQQKRGITNPFSYSGILAAADDQEKGIIEGIIDSKKSGWGYARFIEKEAVYQEFIDRMFSEYGN